jgi:hypothetical protein
MTKWSVKSLAEVVVSVCDSFAWPGQDHDDPALREYLPADRQGVYDSVHSEVYNGLSGRRASVYEANRVLDSCERLTAGEQRIASQARAVKASQDKGFALDTIKQKFAVTRLISS